MHFISESRYNPALHCEGRYYRIKESFKSKSCDYYANAQYPLIMKQQTIADGVVKDLFGVSGKEFQDIKSAIADLQKGELIVKDNTMSELGLGGKKYKKIKVTKLI